MTVSILLELLNAHVRDRLGDGDRSHSRAEARRDVRLALWVCLSPRQAGVSKLVVIRDSDALGDAAADHRPTQLPPRKDHRRWIVPSFR